LLGWLLLLAGLLVCMWAGIAVLIAWATGPSAVIWPGTEGLRGSGYLRLAPGQKAKEHG
jgi:hypothetical protein